MRTKDRGTHTVQCPRCIQTFATLKAPRIAEQSRWRAGLPDRGRHRWRQSVPLSSSELRRRKGRRTVRIEIGAHHATAAAVSTNTFAQFITYT